MCLFSVALLNKLTSSPRSAKSHHRRQPPRDVSFENSEPNRNHLESEDEESIDDDGHHDEVTLSSDHAKPTLTVEVTQADRGILYPVEVKGLDIWRELLEVSGPGSLSLLHSLCKRFMGVLWKGECHKWVEGCGRVCLDRTVLN